MTPRRRRAFGALAIVVGVVAGFLLAWRGPRTPLASAPAPAAPVIEVAEAPPMEAPEPSRTPGHYFLRGERIHEPPPDAPQPHPLGASAAEDYRHRARFPRSSQPIADGVDPIARDREVTPGRSMGPEGSDPTLVVYPARTGFEAPNPIVIYAYLARHGEKVDAREIRGEVRSQDGTTLASLAFSDDGRAGDAVANDLVYTAVLTPTGDDGIAMLKGAQLVEARARTRGDEERVATTGFLYSVPKAHLTGRFRDAMNDGNLVVEAELEVAEEGRFHLEATLASADGTPVAWAQQAMELGPGTAWMTLTYWGLVLRERGVDGPYVVRSAALSTTGEMPNQKNDVLEFAYMTRPYPVAQFSDKPFNDPDLLDAAARLEADARFTRGLEAQPR